MYNYRWNINQISGGIYLSVYVDLYLIFFTAKTHLNLFRVQIFSLEHMLKLFLIQRSGILW